MTVKTYGALTDERRKALSGLEFVQGLASGSLPLNTIAQTLGYDVVEAERGRVVIAAVPNQSHLNPWGTVHGGLTATLLDSCMGLAVQSTLEKGFGSTTLEFKRVLQTLGQGREALAAEHDVSVFEAREHKPEVIKPMIKRLPGDGDAE